MSHHLDYIQIAQIHKRMLKNSGFLSECNVKFICLFYKKISIYKSSIILTEKNLTPKSQVKGFIFVSLESDKYFKKFLFNNLHWIIINPSTYYPVIKSLIRKIFKAMANSFSGMKANEV